MVFMIATFLNNNAETDAVCSYGMLFFIIFLLAVFLFILYKSNKY